MKTQMTDWQAMERRTSRRAYTGLLDVAQQRELEEVIATVNLESGLSFRFLKDGSEAFGGVTNSYGMFSGVRSLILAAGPARGADLKEKVGYHGEQLVLQATKMGLGTCWVGGTFDRKCLATEVPAGQELVAVITVGRVKEDQGLLEKAVGRLTNGKGKHWQQLCETREAPPEWFIQGVKAALLAPSGMNNQPVRFTWKDSGAGAVLADESGFHLVDLGIAKLHFELAADGRFAPGNPAAFARRED